MPSVMWGTLALLGHRQGHRTAAMYSMHLPASSLNKQRWQPHRCLFPSTPWQIPIQKRLTGLFLAHSVVSGFLFCFVLYCFLPSRWLWITNGKTGPPQPALSEYASSSPARCSPEKAADLLEILYFQILKPSFITLKYHYRAKQCVCTV